MALAVTYLVPPAVAYGLIEYLRRLGVMRQLGLSLRRVVPHGGRQMSLNIAASLHLGGNESHPTVFLRLRRWVAYVGLP